MYEGSEDLKRAARNERARERGETVRAELLEKLKASGPQTAMDLLPQVGTVDVSLSEVTFQLDRLADEGRAIRDDEEGLYRLV